jgi:hypothetical protein
MVIITIRFKRDMTALKKCIKSMELLDANLQAGFNKRIVGINKTVLPKNLLRGNTNKVEEDK